MEQRVPFLWTRSLCRSFAERRRGRRCHRRGEDRWRSGLAAWL